MICSEGKGSKGTLAGAGISRVKDTRAAIYQCPSNLRISTVLAFIYPPFTKSGGGARRLGLPAGFGGLLCAIAVLQLQLLLLLHSELFYICLPTFVRICLVSFISFISDCAVAFLSVFLYPSSSVCVCVCCELTSFKKVNS